MYIQLYISLSIYIYICVCVCIYIYIYIYIYIHPRHSAQVIVDSASDARHIDQDQKV